MKKFVSVLSVLLMSSTLVFAQNSQFYNTKHEVAVSVGTLTNSQYLDAWDDFADIAASALVTSVVTGGTYTGIVSQKNDVNLPAISVEYFYHVHKAIGLGGIFTYNGEKSDMYCDYQDNIHSKTTEEKVGTARRHNITIMPAVKFDWLRREHIGLYSKAAVGITFMMERQNQDTPNGDTEVYNDNDLVVNFQATVLGFEAGNERIRGFAELGMGEQGVVQAGLRYKF